MDILDSFVETLLLVAGEHSKAQESIESEAQAMLFDMFDAPNQVFEYTPSEKQDQ